MTAKPLRVVVYAEGPAESRGVFELPPRPRTTISDAALGAAHVLVRRAIENAASDRTGSVYFEEPLRVAAGSREARGADLLSRRTLRRLLAWATNPPDLAIVIVDEDGDAERLATLKSHLDDDWRPPVVIGVAVREFESWLITDMNAVRAALSRTIDEPEDREAMPPRHAKRLLDEWMASIVSSKDRRIARRQIAQTAELSALARSSRSFRRFQDDLRTNLARIG